MFIWAADIITETVVPSLRSGQVNLMEEHHLILIILILIAVVVLISAGKGLGTIINAWIRKLFGTQGVVVNIGEDQKNPGGAKLSADEAQRICKFSPDQCADHKAEYERSKRNVDDIKALKTEFADFKTVFFAKLGNIEAGVNDIKVSLATTMAELHTRLNTGDKF
jgi:hypothetical protein